MEKIEYIEKNYEFKISPGQTPVRLDVFLTNTIPNVTRTKIQKAIEAGNVLVNGKVAKPSQKIKPNDFVQCKILKLPPIELIPEDIKLDIIYEDEYLMLINKQAGIVSHPGYGNRTGTVVNALLFHLGITAPITFEYDPDEDEEQNEMNIFASDKIRPGLVHRLDKDTTGLMLISKDPDVHNLLSRQFAERKVEKRYIALVWGHFDKDTGKIEANIARSKKNRKLFEVSRREGKYALTEYEVLERYNYLTLLKIKLHTGRTHQIRVHFTHINHPLFGDQSYGGNKVIYGNNNKNFRLFAEKLLKSTTRQLLHSFSLSFYHPILQQNLYFEAPLPQDFTDVLDILRNSSFD